MLEPNAAHVAKVIGCEGEPVRALMQAILCDRIKIAQLVNATVISLSEAARGYRDFDKDAAVKFVLNPHGLLSTWDGSAAFREPASLGTSPTGRTCPTSCRPVPRQKSGMQPHS